MALWRRKRPLGPEPPPDQPSVSVSEVLQIALQLEAELEFAVDSDGDRDEELSRIWALVRNVRTDADRRRTRPPDAGTREAAEELEWCSRMATLLRELCEHLEIELPAPEVEPTAPSLPVPDLFAPVIRRPTVESREIKRILSEIFDLKSAEAAIGKLRETQETAFRKACQGRDEALKNGTSEDDANRLFNLEWNSLRRDVEAATVIIEQYATTQKWKYRNRNLRKGFRVGSGPKCSGPAPRADHPNHDSAKRRSP